MLVEYDILTGEVVFFLMRRNVTLIYYMNDAIEKILAKFLKAVYLKPWV